MKKIYLVRHGESEWNKLKKIQGQQNIPLTEKGIEQAKLVGKRLVDEGIEKIYSSDLKRAYDTAKIVGDMLKIDVIPTKGLREINFGIWEGLTDDILKSKFNKEQELWLKEPEKLKIEGAESISELQARAMQEINTIISDNNVNNILIVSHSATLKTIILGLLGINICHFKNLSLKNVSLSIIEFKQHNRVLSLLNDTNHLKESI
ncbi:MAG: histidine phosphatase family protein [Tissierellia bacterium]|nr:histidine phosphatase family protein [Tissierellia bacterium]